MFLMNFFETNKINNQCNTIGTIMGTIIGKIYFIYILK